MTGPISTHSPTSERGAESPSEALRGNGEEVLPLDLVAGGSFGSHGAAFLYSTVLGSGWAFSMYEEADLYIAIGRALTSLEIATGMSLVLGELTDRIKRPQPNAEMITDDPRVEVYKKPKKKRRTPERINWRDE